MTSLRADLPGDPPTGLGNVAGPEVAEGDVVRHDLGPVDAVPLGEGRAYAVDGQQVAVFRTRSGGVHALAAVCTHAGGPLADGQTDADVVLCPLHLHAFDLATGCSRSGDPDLRRYPVTVTDDGRLLVEVPRTIRLP